MSSLAGEGAFHCNCFPRVAEGTPAKGCTRTLWRGGHEGFPFCFRCSELSVHFLPVLFYSCSEETRDSSFEGSIEENQNLSWAKALFAEAKEDLEEEEATDFEQALTTFAQLSLSSQAEVVRYGEAKKKSKKFSPSAVGEVVADKIQAQSELKAERLKNQAKADQADQVRVVKEQRMTNSFLK